MAIPIATASGEIRNGRLFLTDRQAFDDDCRSQRHGTLVEVEVHRLTATRTIQQNRYYWKVVVGRLVKHTHHGPSLVHELMKAKFLPRNYDILSVWGEEVDHLTIGGSTRGLEKDKFFTDYTDHIAVWAGESLGLEIPPPNAPIPEDPL